MSENPNSPDHSTWAMASLFTNLPQIELATSYHPYAKFNYSQHDLPSDLLSPPYQLSPVGMHSPKYQLSHTSFADEPSDHGNQRPLCSDYLRPTYEIGSPVGMHMPRYQPSHRSFPCELSDYGNQQPPHTEHFHPTHEVGITLPASPNHYIPSNPIPIPEFPYSPRYRNMCPSPQLYPSSPVRHGFLEPMNVPAELTMPYHSSSPSQNDRYLPDLSYTHDLAFEQSHSPNDTNGEYTVVYEYHVRQTNLNLPSAYPVSPNSQKFHFSNNEKFQLSYSPTKTSRTPKSDPVIHWSPPPPHIIKLNFDGGFFCDFRRNCWPAGVRAGLFRDHKGTCLHAFADTIPQKNSDFAEASALKKGLLYALDRNWLHIWAEGDAKNIIDNVAGISSHEFSEDVCAEIAEIRFLRQQFKQCSITFIHREGNSAADALCDAVKFQHGSHNFNSSDLPNNVHQILEAERKGKLYQRQH